MAVPASGSISLRGIRNELHNNNYSGSNTFSNVSLKDMSTGNNGAINTNNAIADRPDGVAPHAMTEFYNYDHDKAPPGAVPGVLTFQASFSCGGGGQLNMSGNVSNNTPPTTEYGFVYSSMNTTPTIGQFGTTKLVSGTNQNSTSFFYSDQTQAIMVPCCCGSMNYYIRAYATNSVGTGYGNVRVVTATDCSCGGGDPGDPDGPGGPGGPGDGFGPQP